MAIKVGGTTVVDDSRQLTNIASVDATTVAALGAAGVGGGGGSVDLQVSETVTAGDPVILASNGNIEKVSATPENGVNSISVLNDLMPSAGAGHYSATVYVSAYDYFVTFFQDSSGSQYLDYTSSRTSTAADGTITNTILQQEINVNSSYGTVSSVDAVYDAGNNRIIFVFYSGQNGNSYVCVATPASDGTLSFGSFTQVAYGPTVAVTYDTNSDKVVVAFRNQLDGYKSYYRVGSISGTTVSLGYDQIFYSSTTQNFDELVQLDFDTTSNKVIIAYRDLNNGNYGTVRIGSVNAANDTISWGTPVVYVTANSDGVAVRYDEYNDKVIVFYHNDSNSTLNLIAGTISGTSITFGSNYSFQSSAIYNQIDLDVDANTGLIFLAYRRGNDGWARVTNLTSGTSFATVSSEVQIDNSAIEHIRAEMGGPYVLISFRRSTTALQFKSALIYQSSADDFIGVAAENITSGSTGEITILGGVNEAVSGLTAGSDYYATSAGTIAVSGDLKIGRALASNKLLITSGGA